MNNDEKKIDQIQAEADRLETVLTSLNEKIDKLPTKADVEDIKTKLKEKKDTKARIETGAGSARKILSDIAEASGNLR